MTPSQPASASFSAIPQGNTTSTAGYPYIVYIQSNIIILIFWRDSFILFIGYLLLLRKWPPTQLFVIYIVSVYLKRFYRLLIAFLWTTFYSLMQVIRSVGKRTFTHVVTVHFSHWNNCIGSFLRYSHLVFNAAYLEQYKEAFCFCLCCISHKGTIFLLFYGDYASRALPCLKNEIARMIKGSVFSYSNCAFNV